MSKIQLDKDLVSDLVYSVLGERVGPWMLIHKEITGTWRWGNECYMVIRHETDPGTVYQPYQYYGYAYRTTSRDTENSFWDEQPDQVELHEVRPVEITTVSYEEVRDAAP